MEVAGLVRIGSLYGFHLLRLVDISALHPVLTSLRSVLADIDKEISSLSAELEKTDDDEESVGIDGAIQDQAVFYHEMLGMAFVACQVEITRAVAEVWQIHKLAKRKRVELRTTSVDKREIMRVGFADPGKPSTIEVIDAAANYQKHSDEWPRDWDVNPPPNPNSVKTIKVLLALGIKPDDFVIDACAQHLGIKKTADVMRLLDHLATWRSELARAYKGELVREGVHPPDGAP